MTRDPSPTNFSSENPTSSEAASAAASAARAPALIQIQIHRHLRLGWAVLAVAAALGLGLEAMHALRLGLYLDLGAATRRHMWTLAHAHGTLLGLVQLGLAATLHAAPALAAQRSARVGARLLTAATLLIPGGFFLGGVWFYGGDPGLGILLVPVGGVALVVGLVLVGAGLRGRGV